MRVLIATDAFPPKCGGSGWSTFYLARALAAQGHTVEIAKPEQGLRGIQSGTYQGLRVVQVGYHASNLPGLRAWQRTQSLEQNFSTHLAARAPEFDLIHAQHLLTIPAALHAKKNYKVPVVSTVRDYWAVCLYGTLWREGAVCPICRGTEITRCLAQKYGNTAPLMLPAVPLVERELARRQRALRESDAVIAASHFVADQLREIVDKPKLAVVPNLVDLDESRRIAEEEPETSYPPAFLLFVGKLNRLKGADLLPKIMVESCVSLPLLVVGDGELEGTLRQGGLDVRGWLENSEVLRLLSRATALVFPSRWAEPLARTLLEAQALGTPTIALNTGGTRDIISDSVNGLLANNANEFAVKLARLANDPSLQECLRVNGRRVAEERFSAKAVVRQVEAIYERVVNRNQ